MNRQPPPLLGFNNNVRHNGRLFHVQTEDSGTKYCRVMTHLFADGGRILRTSRTDYAAKLDDADFTEQLRRLMKEQHRAMLTALRKGEFDELIHSTFESSSPVTAGASPLCASQAPASSREDLPALSLPVIAPSADVEPTAASSLLTKRPSNRPTRHSSHPAPKTAAAAATPPTSSNSRLNLGRPPMVSSESARLGPSRSLFGNTGSSEPSLGEAILSYVEESTEKGSGRA